MHAFNDPAIGTYAVALSWADYILRAWYDICSMAHVTSHAGTLVVIAYASCSKRYFATDIGCRRSVDTATATVTKEVALDHSLVSCTVSISSHTDVPLGQVVRLIGTTNVDRSITGLVYRLPTDGYSLVGSRQVLFSSFPCAPVCYGVIFTSTGKVVYRETFFSDAYVDCYVRRCCLSTTPTTRRNFTGNGLSEGLREERR